MPNYIEIHKIEHLKLGIETTISGIEDTVSGHINNDNGHEDDHIQYFLLAGRSGGQIAYGGTGSGDNLTLNSTSNATKGNVILQSAGGNVGIGTASPDDKCHIYNNANSPESATIENASTGANAYAALRFKNATNNTAQISRVGSGNSAYAGANSLMMYQGSNYPLGFVVNNILQATINSTGLGIGTASPDDKVHIEGPGNIKIRLTTTSAVDGYCGFRFNEGSTMQGYLHYDTNNDFFRWNTANQDLYLDVGNGKIGIGTDSPGTALHIKGNEALLRMEGSDHCYMEFYPDGPTTRKGYFGYPGASIDDIWLNNTNGNICLLSTGGVGIGTTSVNSNNILQVAKDNGSIPALTSSSIATFINSSATTDSALLHVISGNAAVSGITFGDTDSAVQGYIRYDNNSSSMSIRTAATSAIDIDSSQQVGIGRTPTCPFDVNGAANGSPTTSGTATTGVSARIGSSDTTLCLDIGMLNTGSVYAWLQARDEADHSSNSPIVLNPNGARVGVGCAPSFKFHVEGGSTGASRNIAMFADSAAADNTDHYISIGKAFDTNQCLHIGHHYDSDGATSSYSWLTNGGESVGAGINIASGGKVGIGIFPSYKLHVTTAHSSGYSGKFVNSGSTSAYYGIRIQAGENLPSSNSDCRWIDFSDGDDTAVSYLGYSTSSPYAALYSASDARLKDNIKNTEVNGLDIIKNIKLRSFDWKPRQIEDKKTGLIKTKQRPHQKLGLVAQELLNTFPDAVAYNDINDEYTVAESTLLLPLVGAVQSLIKQNEQLTNKINELESEIEKFKK